MFSPATICILRTTKYLYSDSFTYSVICVGDKNLFFVGTVLDWHAVGRVLSFNLGLNESYENQVSLMRFRGYNPNSSESSISSRSKSSTGSTP